MKVETETITVYYFTKDEADMLHGIGVWELLHERLTPYERIEVE